jgi:arylsulfatase
VGGIDISCGRTKPGGACIDALALPIFYNKTITEQPVDLTTVSTQYATAGANFVASAAGKPFFLYVANSHVHVPQNHAARWTGKSTIGPFGDALMEMDWEIGEIMHAVEAAGVAEDTLYLVSGDNGPWECKCNLTGSSGPYVGGWQKANGGGSSRKMTLCA